MTDVAVAILSALAGFLVWITQRHFERQETERQRKEGLYGTLLSACIEFVGTGNGAPFIIESQRAWVYASDAVLEAINEYLKAFVAYGDARAREVDSSETWKAVMDAEGRLRLTIRQELHPKTRINGDWVKGQWQMATSSAERIREYLRRDSSTRNESPSQPK
jgi:hypothetical protein